MTTDAGTNAVQVIGDTSIDTTPVLTREALAFVARLHLAFNPTRERLLDARRRRQAALDAGQRPSLLEETAHIRAGDWQVARPPALLSDRVVEITGPVDRKMMINALNSGASTFMADLEDSLAPTWTNVLQGHANLFDAVHGRLAFTSPDGRDYTVGARTATLLVRPRGWHLEEPRVLVQGRPVSASLFDFGLFFFHNARALAERNAGPFVYLPKMESHLEARLWNEVFFAAQDALGVARGTIRATVLIETILAAFEMEEILYELRDHGAALNAGRWDYIFSIIKKFRGDPAFVLPDRSAVAMTVPFMRAYAERLVRTCHRRGAQAIGGMAAFVPSRRDEVVNRTAFAKVREDKEREASQGFVGTWVAHPDLVPVAREAFMAEARTPSGGSASASPTPDAGVAALLDVRVPGGRVTMAGVETNVRIALEYLAAWIGGLGAVAIDNLMEDTATAEISRAQLWQWRRHRVPVTGAGPVTAEMYGETRDKALATLRTRDAHAPFTQAAALLDDLVLSETFADFLTLPGAPYLEAANPAQ